MQPCDTVHHNTFRERVPAQCPRPRQVNHGNEEVFQVPAEHIEHHQDDDFEDETRFPKLGQWSLVIDQERNGQSPGGFAGWFYCSQILPEALSPSPFL